MGTIKDYTSIAEIVEISGLAISSYNSGSINRLYVDTISSNLLYKINNIAPGSNISWNTPTVSSGMAITGDGKISGNLGLYIHNMPNKAFKSGNIFNDILNWHEKSGQKYSDAYASAQSIKGMAIEDASVVTPRSGQILMYQQDNKVWRNVPPPMTFSISNIKMSAQQNINLARFKCPDSQRVYIWQASACGSGGVAISGMFIQMLSNSTLPLLGSHSKYKTSCQILQIGYPLARSNAGDYVEIRFMYSGTSNGILKSGYKYGTGFMNISIY